MTFANLDICSMDDRCFAALRNMAGRVAHDLNNILTPLVAYPDIIRDEIKPESEIFSALAAMENSVSAIKNFCDRLLLFSGAAITERSTKDICALVSESIKNIRMNSRFASIKIEENIQAAPLFVKTSEQETDLVVNELCSNSILALNGNGVIRISVHSVTLSSVKTSVLGTNARPGAYAVITVSDNGPGIHPKLRWSAINPFVSGWPACSNSERRGTGMGLSLVYAFTRDHGGFMDIECPPGSGTIVTVGVPLEPKEAKA